MAIEWQGWSPPVTLSKREILEIIARAVGGDEYDAVSAILRLLEDEGWMWIKAGADPTLISPTGHHHYLWGSRGVYDDAARAFQIRQQYHEFGWVE